MYIFRAGQDMNVAAKLKQNFLNLKVMFDFLNISKYSIRAHHNS